LTVARFAILGAICLSGARFAILSAICLSGGIAAVDGRAGQTGLVADSVVVDSSRSSHLSISGSPRGLVATPEGLSTEALGVVVGGGRTISLLFLVVADEEEVEGDTEEKEEHGQDGHGEGSGVERASIAIVTGAGSAFVVKTNAKGGIDDSATATGTVAGIICNGCKASNETDVEENTKEAEDGDAAKAEGEDDAEDGVQSGGT